MAKIGVNWLEVHWRRVWRIRSDTGCFQSGPHTITINTFDHIISPTMSDGPSLRRQIKAASFKKLSITGRLRTALG